MKQPLVEAAEYLRMSTEEQPNSIVLQQAAIQRYAAAHGYRVTASYSDPGKSGIGIKHRPGLQRLIRDVVGGNAGFHAVLVYDVSRWGRFQDVDESAHYEFLCREAGVQIVYCVEQFQNTGGMSNDIMKAMKRTMAAEYSRELAAKTYAGQKHLVIQGYRTGGAAGYGLRRMLISSGGGRRLILQPNERKFVKSDRIVLVPGPRREVECIRTIFSLAAEKRKTPKEISEELNCRGVKCLKGKPWVPDGVWRILKNEKYMGWNVWGKTKKPFGKRTEKLSRDLWIAQPDAFAPLVSPEQFARVQRVLHGRNKKIGRPDSRYLDELRRVLKREGRLSQIILTRRGRFSVTAYRCRFGSLMNAYRLVGYKPSDWTCSCAEGRSKIHSLRLHLLTHLTELFPGTVRILPGASPKTRRFLELDGSRVAVHMCALVRNSRRGALRWRLEVNSEEASLVSLVCLSNRSMSGFSGLYVLPELASVIRRNKTLYKGHPLLRGGIQLQNLSQFYEAAGKMLKDSNPLRYATVAGDTVFVERGSLLTIGQQKFTLGPIQGAILKKLIENTDRYVAIEELCCCTVAKNKRSVVAHIFKIRKKLGRRLRGRIVAGSRGEFTYKFISDHFTHTVSKSDPPRMR